MNIIIKEFSFYRLQILLWSLILSAISITLISLYPLYIANKDNLEIIFRQSSIQIECIFGISNLDIIFSPTGYYALIFSILRLISTISACIIGFRIVYNDALNDSAEFLFTKPISRKKLLTFKIIAGLISLILINFVLQIVTISCDFIINKISILEITKILKINFGLLLTNITFLFISMMIGTFINNKKNIIIGAILSVFLFYFLSLIEVKINSNLLRYINPFSYFKAEDIINLGKFKPSFIITSVFLTFFCVDFAYIHFETMDIH